MTHHQTSLFTLPRAAHEDGSGGLATDAAGPPDPVTLQKAIDATIALTKSLLKKTGIPGIAVGIVSGSKTVSATGYGVCKAGGADLVDRNTVFQLASMSKPIGATVVAQQIGAGVVTWDSKVKDLSPHFNLSNATATQEARVSDFYAHRSGLPDHAGDVLDVLGYGGLTIRDRVSQLPLNGFCTEYAYTNTGITIAANAVSIKAKQSWAMLSSNALYRPLGMTRTTSDFAPFMAQNNRAVGHMQVAGKLVPCPTRDTDAQSPAGGVSSSVADLSKWMSLILGRGYFEGQHIIPEVALAPALTPHMPMPPAPPGLPETSYGYGFMIGKTKNGLVTYGHSGDFVPGASTTFLIVPALDLGIVVLTNATALGAAQAIAYSFMDYAQYGKVTEEEGWFAILKPVYAAATGPKGAYAGKSPPSPPIPSQPLSAYTGTYQNNYYGNLTVSESAGQLVLTIGPQNFSMSCQHWSGDSFVASLPQTLSPAQSAFQVTFSGTPPSIVASDFFGEAGVNLFTR